VRPGSLLYVRNGESGSGRTVVPIGRVAQSRQVSPVMGVMHARVRQNGKAGHSGRSLVGDGRAYEQDAHGYGRPVGKVPGCATRPAPPSSASS
jgi:hypothetical protein